MRRWVLTALQLNTYGGYASLNMNSHRTDTDLSQIVCSVHACRTKCLLFPQQPAGWVAQDVIWHVCTAQATCKSCAQVAYESSPRFACLCLGAASVFLQQRMSMISSLTALLPCATVRLAELQCREKFVFKVLVEECVGAEELELIQSVKTELDLFSCTTFLGNFICWLTTFEVQYNRPSVWF